MWNFTLAKVPLVLFLFVRDATRFLLGSRLLPPKDYTQPHGAEFKQSRFQHSRNMFKKNEFTVALTILENERVSEEDDPKNRKCTCGMQMCAFYVLRMN